MSDTVKEYRMDQVPFIAPEGWTNAPTLNQIQEDIKTATVDHNTVLTNLDRWERNLKGELPAGTKIPANRSKIQPKLIRKQAEWRYSSMAEPFLSNRDIFKADPVTYEDIKAAKQNELVLNHQFNTKIPKVKFINEYVRSAINKGTVICKVGWEYADKQETVVKPIYEYTVSEDPEYLAYLEEAVQYYMVDPITFKREQPEELTTVIEMSLQEQAAVMATQIGTEEVVEVKVLKNHPTVQVRPVKNIILDPTCDGDITKAGFVIDMFPSSISELKKKGIYKNLEYIDAKNASPLAASSTELETKSSFTFKDKPRMKVVVHEYWGYWDIKGDDTTTLIVVSMVGDVIIRMAENPFPFDGFPFVVVPYLPVEESLHGEPDGELLEDNQKIVGAVTRGMIDTMARSATGQRGIAKDVLDVSNMRKFKAGEDYEYNPNTHPDRAFYMHKFAEIPQSAAYMLDMQNNQADALTGVKAFSDGISGGALGNTATGVRSALDATSKRDLEILMRLATGIVEIGRLFMAMNAVFLDEPEVVRITNQEFAYIDAEDLQGLVDISLTISTAETDNAKADQLAFMLQTTGQMMGIEMAKIVLAEIATLRKMPHLAKKIEDYAPEPDPIEQEKRALEVELLRAQIQEVSGKAAQTVSTAQLNQVKMGTEQAKQRALGSAADKTDLDFVEQESGTDHARELQKQGAQAQANMALAALKESLKLK